MLTPSTASAILLVPERPKCKFQISGLGGRTMKLGVFAAFLALPAALSAAPIVLDFESLSDLEAVTTQFAGLTFTNTISLEAGISLNEFEFPPASGNLVVSDDFGPIEIAFANPISYFGGLFTYLVPLTLSAFDTAGAPVDSRMSLFASNLALSGDGGSAPNELLAVSFGGGFSRVRIEGDAFGGSFTLDDAAFEPVTDQVIPEPETISLLLLGLLAFGWLKLMGRHSARPSPTAPSSGGVLAARREPRCRFS